MNREEYLEKVAEEDDRRDIEMQNIQDEEALEVWNPIPYSTRVKRESKLLELDVNDRKGALPPYEIV